MQRIVEKKELMERVHLLIKRRGTGTPDELAERLQVSRATVHRIMDTMKELGAPILYNFLNQTYEYEHPVNFFFGFISNNDLEEIEGREINGGFGALKKLNFL